MLKKGPLANVNNVMTWNMEVTFKPSSFLLVVANNFCGQCEYEQSCPHAELPIAPIPIGLT